MPRTRYSIVEFHSLDALLSLADALAAALPDDSGDQERAMRSIDSMRTALIEYDSPFLRYRKEILGSYTTAQRLAALTLHLWNSRNPVDLAFLLSGADQRHQRIALELIASYAEHSESDPHFMNLADEIRDLQKAAA